MNFRIDEFDVFEKGDFMETIRNVEINQLHDFRNHPILLSQPEHELIVNAKAAVLIPGHTALWWTNFAKMVDYIALQVPVLEWCP